MTVLDELQQLEQHIVKRAAELRGAVEEFDQLRQAAARLGIDLDDVKATPARARRNGRAGSTSPTRGRAGAPRGKRSTTTRAKRTPGGPRSRGSRSEDVMQLVKQRPGITVAELGKALGVNATGLYRVVRELEGAGKVRKDGRNLAPAGR